MPQQDFILIAQSETIQYDEFSDLPLDRLELFQNLIYPRMIRFEGKFYSHLDIVNKFFFNSSFSEANFPKKRQLLSLWNLPSFAGVYLANLLTSMGIHTKIINNFDAEYDIFCETYNKSPKKPIVGISTTFHLNWASIKRLVKKLRSIDANMHIVAGGAFFPTLAMDSSPEQWAKNIKNAGLNAVFSSMNSETELCDYLLNNKLEKSKKISNLNWLDDNGVYHSEEKKWMEPITTPLPNCWQKLDLSFLKRTIQLRTVIGCPFACAFCSYPVMSKGFHPMSLDAVENLLENLKEIKRIKQLVILDDTANVPPKRFINICKLIQKTGWSWFSFLRPQFLNEETVSLMKESGCEAVYLGIESANDNILSAMNKKASNYDMAKGINLLNKYGIKSMGSFIVGFPGETEKTINETFNFIENSGLDFYALKEFFYISSTGVDYMRDKYSLEGIGNKWSHYTMDSTEASQAKIYMFKNIKNSVHLDPDAGIWHLVAMLDAGFSMADIVEIQKNINLVIVSQLDGDFNDKHIGFKALSALAQKKVQLFHGALD